MFKAKPIYIKIRRNHIEVTDLKNGRTVSKQAITPFSSVRNVVGTFHAANETITAALRELGIKPGFLSTLRVLIQQLEGIEGGLSDIEKRAMRDLAEMAGANKVFILEETSPVSAEQALYYLK